MAGVLFSNVETLFWTFVATLLGYTLYLRATRKLITVRTPMASNLEANGDTYHPNSLREIEQAASLLCQKLPAELVRQVLDDAEYWHMDSSALDTNNRSYMEQDQRSHYATTHTMFQQGYCFLTTPRILSSSEQLERHPIRKIEFTITSRDQGWSGDTATQGTREGSWTWFDAVVINEKTILFPDPDLSRGERPYGCASAAGREAYTEGVLPGFLVNPAADPATIRDRPPWSDRRVSASRRLATNIHAGRDWETQTVTWLWNSADEDDRAWLRNLQKGDSVGVAAWAKFPAWACIVQRAEITVYVAGF